jgi:hypothetical protein
MTFIQELGKSKENENLQKILQEKMALRLRQMMQNYKKKELDPLEIHDKEQFEEPPTPTLPSLQKKSSKNKRPKEKVHKEKKLVKIEQSKKSSLTKTFKPSSTGLTHFKDINEHSDNDGKPLDDYSSGYNDYYSEKKSKLKKRQKSIKVEEFDDEDFSKNKAKYTQFSKSTKKDQELSDEDEYDLHRGKSMKVERVGN